MSVLFVVIPIALLASAAAVGAFVWAVRRGQLDDLTTPAYRILEGDQDGARAPAGEHIGSVEAERVRSAGNEGDGQVK